MKIAMVFGEFLTQHRPMNFPTIWNGSRGVSGSDLGISRISQELVNLGHDVSLFTVHEGEKPDVWEGIKLYHATEKAKIIDTTFDAIISWCVPDDFRDLPIEPVRLCSQQLNGFTYCKPGYDDFVDIWASPSQSHMNLHAPMTASPHKWCVIPDGCDPHIYSNTYKEHGRVVHTSSPDRGLHWLLQEWPNIKARVPKAHLRVFYHLSPGDVESFEKRFKIWTPGIMELGQRIRYIRHAVKRLAPLDVAHVGSVSRDQMTQELDAAQVFAYPASVVSDYCEGFSVSTMEACAAGCVPVISDVDALGSIYGGVVPMIKTPVQPNMGQFTDYVVRAMTDEVWRQEVVAKCRELASKYTWKSATEQYVKVIKEHPKYRGTK